MRRLAILLILAAAPALADTNPKQAAVHSRQGKAYFDAKQYDQAIEEFKKSFDLDPKSVTLFKIASAYYAKADYQGAIDYYAKYLASDPDGPLANQAIEFTTIAKKALDDAKAKAEAEAKAKAEAEAKAKADQEADARRVGAAAHTKQATAFEQAGAWTSAGDEYRAAAEAGQDPEFLLQAGAAYAKQDNEKARAAYQAYLEKVPLGPKSDDARAKVAELTRAIDKAVAEREAAAKAEQEARLRMPVAPREEHATFEFAASLAPGVKLQTDNPFVIALRGEAALRFGTRVNLGIYAEYARLSTGGSCGTNLPGPDPSTDFDFGPRNSLGSCWYFLPGLQLQVHVLPANTIDPYIGVSPGFRIASASWDTHFGGMETHHKDKLFGIVSGFRAGVDYHLSHAVHAWTIGGFAELTYQFIGDKSIENDKYASMFIGGRSTVTY